MTFRFFAVCALGLIAACVSFDNSAPQLTLPASATVTAPAYAYDRDRFGGWIDADGDCLNTRHELLLQTSQGPIARSPDGCLIVAGRWLDPYTGKTFTDSSDLDVDHVVPLAWAWRHGAYAWTDDERRIFANDTWNLLLVDDRENSRKSARGPLDWLPPDSRVHCFYVTRFSQLILKYELRLTQEDVGAFQSLLRRKCADA